MGGAWLGPVPLSYDGYLYRFYVNMDNGDEAYSDAVTLTVLCPHDDTYETMIAPDCVNTGLREIYCECGELLESEVIPALDHDWILISVGPGGKVYECARCGETYTVHVDRVDVSAAVIKLKGNQNELIITITEYYADDTSVTTSYSIIIDNNAAGTYKVGVYNVYVDTKGNEQIRACYITG
jgi:hypothetical protein